MFQIDTTIVLGAGSSWSYGFPLGGDLVDVVIRRAYEKDDGDAHTLAQMLEFYDPISIDSFLWHHSENLQLVDTAKRLIAECLFLYASEEKFERGANNNNEYTNWYRFLWDAIVSGQTAEQLASEDNRLRVTIITFNYDGSLERYLYSRVTAVGSLFNKNQQTSFLKKLRDSIIHVYGCIHDYQWTGGTLSNNTYEIDHQVLEEAAQAQAPNILLIDERQETNYNNIQEALKTANQVIFLGFGFDDLNIGPKVLNLEKVLYPKRAARTFGREWWPVIKYTNVGESGIIRDKIRSIFNKFDEEEINSQIFLSDAVSLIESSNKVFQALENDFSLNRV